MLRGLRTSSTRWLPVQPGVREEYDPPLLDLPQRLLNPSILGLKLDPDQSGFPLGQSAGRCQGLSLE